MSSPCSKCRFLRTLPAPVYEPEFPRIVYEHGCGYSVVPPPMFQIQSGRSMLWSADKDATQDQKMLIFSNIETTTCYVFEGRDPDTAAQQEA